MKQSYVYVWLDELISNELNPDLKDLSTLLPDQADAIYKQLRVEEPAMQARLKNLVFKQNNDVEAGTLVRKHYEALAGMIIKSYAFLNLPVVKGLPAEGVLRTIVHRLQHMHSAFEQEFRLFLTDDYPVPLHLLLALRAEMFLREMEVKQKLSNGDMGTGPVHIVMEMFLDFSEKIDRRQVVSVREAAYIRSVFYDILALDGELTSITGYPALDELLIVWNLNSKTCIQYFTQGYDYLAGRLQHPKDRLEFLREELKKLQIVPERKGYCLNSDLPGLKAYLLRWLNNEIRYLESRNAGFTAPAMERAAAGHKEQAFKVVVSASADQLGLLLRAADDTRMVSARSMSAVFKAIVPHLSTPYTENLNWNRTRTAGYSAEESDKRATIQMLEKMIARIKEY